MTSKKLSHAPRQRTHKNNQSAKQAKSTCKTLVLIDSHPLRTHLWQQYQSMIKKMEKSSKELRKFHQEDINQFDLWNLSCFGSKLNEIHKVKDQIEEMYLWLAQIEGFAELHDLSIAESYRQLSQAKAEGRFDALLEVMAAAMNSEEVNSKEDQHWQKVFDSIFEEFEEHSHSRFDPRSEGASRSEVKQTRSPSENESRILFHKIANQLHPDKNPDLDQQSQDLFHHAQTAYKNQDIEELEKVLTKLNGDQAELFSWKNARISDIIARKKALLKRYNDVQTEIKFARSHPAWKFTDKRNDPKNLKRMRDKIQSTLDRQLLSLNAEWLEISHELNHLEKKATRKSRQAKKTKRQPKT